MNRRLYVFMLAAVMAAALGLGGCMAGDGKKEENEKPVVVFSGMFIGYAVSAI